MMTMDHGLTIEWSTRSATPFFSLYIQFIHNHCHMNYEHRQSSYNSEPLMYIYILLSDFIIIIPFLFSIIKVHVFPYISTLTG